MKQNLPSQPFHTDRPITSCKEDELERKAFAWATADRLVAWGGQDSIVVALYGGWGTGKSSVKNMALERIKNRASEGDTVPVVVEFNPWQFSGSDQLCAQFFEVLADCLTKHLPNAKSKRARSVATAERLRRYGRYLTWGGNMAKAVATLATPFVGPAALAAIPVAETLKNAADLAESGAAASEESDPGLAETKRLLHDDFLALKQKLLVVIDDIDRLASDEICLLFRTIRANADFPNLIFVLLMQRDSAEKALDKISNGYGSQFLEKIVQVPFDLPEPAINSVHQVVARGIDAILSPLLSKDEWDKKRWPDLWHGGLRSYFSNLREAYRYLNALAFSAGVFKGAKAFEVNPIDLIALEALRLFEPKVFELLPQYKSQLLKSEKSGNGEDELIQVYDSLIKAAKKAEAVKAILPQLFPLIQRITRKTHYSSREWGRTWKRKRRVTDENFFDRYFQLGLPLGQATESDIRLFIQNSGKYAAMRKIFTGWKKSGCMASALERLDAEDSLRKLVDPVPYISSSLDESEDLGTVSIYLIPWNLTYYATNWAQHYIRAAPDQATRDALALKFIRSTKGLYATLEFVIDLVREPRDNDGEKADPLLSTDGQNAVKKEILARVGKLVTKKTLLKHPKFKDIFWRWLHLADVDARKWAREQLKGFSQAGLLLRAFASESSSNPLGSYYVGKHHMLSLKNIEEIASLDEWKTALKKPRKRKLSEETQALLALFSKALERRAKGLPDNNWDTHQDNEAVDDD